MASTAKDVYGGIDILVNNAGTDKKGAITELSEQHYGRIVNLLPPIDGPYACKFVGEVGFEGLQINIGDYERGFSMSKKFVQDAYLEMAEASTRRIYGEEANTLYIS